MRELKSGHFRALAILWAFRRKVYEGVINDIRHRYAGSVLGLGWSVVFPVAQIAIYAVVYVFILRVRPAGMDQMQYIMMVFAGLVPLMAFNEALSAGAAALSNNKVLLTSTVFPPELIPVRTILAAQIPSLLGFLIVALITMASGFASLYSFVLVPILWISLLLFAIGISWILSLVSLIARDIQQILPLALMALMILSPFAYTPAMVPAGLKVILYANPLSYFVLCFQDMLTFGKLPDPLFFGLSLAIGGGTFLLGFAFFRKAKNVFFDYV